MQDRQTPSQYPSGLQAPQAPQFKQIQQYVIGSAWKLGSGSFSEVYKAVDQKDNRQVAAKIIKMQKINNKVALTLLRQEIEIIKRVSHPNILSYYDVFSTPNHCYVFCQLCPYGDLDSLLKMKRHFQEEQIDVYVHQIYSGMKYLSENNIVHRDLKPANIFIAEGNICKIADFGFAISNPEGQAFKDIALGSPAYMAPQILLMKEYGPKTDVWAFGCLLYELVAGHSPFYEARTPEQLKQKVLLPVPTPKHPFSPQLLSFISNCLCVSTSKRISFEEMQKHPYMQKVRKKVEEMSHFKESSDTLLSTEASKNFLQRILNNNLIGYDEAAALLQYCGLVQLVLRVVKSEILKNWQLTLLKDLQASELKPNPYANIKRFKLILQEKGGQYRKELGKPQRSVDIREVVEECGRMLETCKKERDKVRALGSETCLLREARGHPLKLIYYAKNSRILEYSFTKS